MRPGSRLNLVPPIGVPGGLDRVLDEMPLAQHGETPTAQLGALIAAGLDRLPLPGSGATWQRWQALARVAGHDLSLAKLFESHTDALAILAELDGLTVELGSSWGVWAADPPDAKVTLKPVAGTALKPGSIVRLDGRKAWCSGAEAVSHALVSVQDAKGAPYLAAVALDQPGIRCDRQPWQAVGMAGSASIDVDFSAVEATLVGESGKYLARPGFWHGGAGVAACWYGAAAAIGARMRQAESRRTDPHFMAHLGQVAVALVAARAVLAEIAQRIDAGAGSMAEVLQARLTVESCATAVISHAGRALGAGPLCREAHFAALMADLPVFIRQSHAERDLAVLGAAVLEGEAMPWTL